MHKPYFVVKMATFVMSCYNLFVCFVIFSSHFPFPHPHPDLVPIWSRSGPPAPLGTLPRPLEKPLWSKGLNMSKGRNMSKGQNMSKRRNMSKGRNMSKVLNMSKGLNMSNGLNMSKGQQMSD